MSTISIGITADTAQIWHTNERINDIGLTCETAATTLIVRAGKGLYKQLAKLTAKGSNVNYALLLIAAGIAAFLITASHRPDAVLDPQFWAEDGKMWYQQAYNNGWLTALFTPEAGYYQTISRIVAAASLLLPLAWAPAFFNITAITAKSIAAVFITSRRMSDAIPDVRARLVLAFFYAAIPASYETTANLTNVQWHLALLAFLIIVARPAATSAGRVFDAVFLALSALSGPFCLLLTPIALVQVVIRRTKMSLLPLGIMLIGSLIQASSLLSHERPSDQILGATPALFLKILGGHWFFNAIFGDANYARLLNRDLWSTGAAAAFVAIGVLTIGYAFLKAKSELRLLIVFACLIVMTALIMPAISRDDPQWQIMAREMVGSRYWLIPIFTFFASAMWIAFRSKVRGMRYAYAGVLILSLTGIYADWRQPKFQDLKFREHAAEFDAAPAGAVVVIPINPNWEMRLIKK